MSKYKLIAFDMDGTLLNSEKKLLQSSIDAIRECTNAGKYVVLSTGRNMQELKATIKELPELSYAIAISGGLIYNTKTSEIVYSKALPDDVICELFKRTRGYDVMIHAHSIESITERSKEAHMKDYSMGVYQEMFDKLTIRPENLEEYYLKERFPIYKFNFYCQSPAQRKEIERDVCGLTMTTSYAETASLECSALGISKGFGLKKLCEHLNIHISETIAVGDGENDLEILKTAGLSVAMGNALDCVKEISDVTVKDNDSDGCAQTIYEYLL